MSDVSTAWKVQVPTNASRWLKLLAFSGPGIMVSVGYMDPGNWATDLVAGSKFGYKLLWVILATSLLAMYLQVLSVRLGLGGDVDLATACRLKYPKALCRVLWVMSEVAIVACDIAEVMGSAVALQLLFGLPLLAGVLITGLDVLVLLGLTKLGFRWIEALVATLVLTVSGCFLIEMVLAKPDLGVVTRAALMPSLQGSEQLLVALGILGATVMPHNLYLQSATVRARAGQVSKKESIGYSTTETIIALSLAFFVNGAILILAATQFHNLSQPVEEINKAFLLLKPLLGGLSATIFAVALLASGQSSTVTGTLAGQVVMDGFVQLRVAPWLRRLVGRGLAIIPAAVAIAWFGESRTTWLIIVSQLVLSFQLPFAIGPLVQFTGDRSLMGDFASPKWVTWIGGRLCFLICALNLWLLKESMADIGLPALGIPVMILGILVTLAIFVWMGRSHKLSVQDSTSPG